MYTFTMKKIRNKVYTAAPKVFLMVRTRTEKLKNG